MSLFELAAKGGWPMIPIGICSLLACVITLERMFMLRSLGLQQPLKLAALLSAPPCFNTTPCHPVERVLKTMWHCRTQRPERLEAEALRAGQDELASMETNLTLLAFLAQASPLLGLFGTVVGMVELFMDLQQLDTATLSIARLADGIWQALLTTAAGLVVAVPCLAAHTYFVSRIERLRQQLEHAVSRAQTCWPPCTSAKPTHTASQHPRHTAA